VRQRVLTALLAVAGVTGILTMTAAVPPAAARPASAPAAAAAGAAAGGWGKATLLPGTGSLSSGGAEATTVSCHSAGNCTAGGTVFRGGGAEGVFVSSEQQGRWGTPKQIPGLAALNTGHDAELARVSCASAGNCVAAGTYFDSAGRTDFVAIQRNWQWGSAEEIPGLAALNHDGDASVESVYCVAPGSCAVGGSYLDDNDVFQAFVVTLSSWNWGTAIEVPGTAALNVGGMAQVNAVSCAKPGDCSAGGYYRPTKVTTTAFVVTEQDGSWGSAVKVPGIAALNAGGSAALSALSCGSAGDCGAGGSYLDASGHRQAFLVTQRSGHWNTATEARATGALNAGGSAGLSAISCPSPGNCAAGGTYEPTSNHVQLFLITESKGAWGKAIAMPGILTRNKGTSTQVFSLRCSSAGNCAAGGYYENAAFRQFAYVITESGGRWGAVTEVPGIASVSPASDSQVVQVSCPSDGHCTGVGDGFSAAHKARAFFVTRT
jgi:hypothetical protein